MKKILLLFLFFGHIGFGQTKGISYQALILDPITQELPGFDNNKAPLANKNICLKFSFIDELNTIEYEEIFSTKTDPYGMVNLIIGTETKTGGYASSFEDIKWSTLPKNLKIDLSVDPSCSSFTEISNAPFTAVPFALFAINTQENTLMLENQKEIALLKALIKATQLGAGLDAGGGYTPETTTFFINSVTSLKEADTVLDKQVKTNENNINANNTSITTNTSNITTNSANIISNATSIASKVSITDIVDDLTTGGTTAPLSAEQGKVLKGLVDSSVNIVVEDVLTSSSTINALSANQGRELKAYVDATNSTNANLTGMVTSVGNATTVVTNANLTGDVTSVGNATTIGADKVVSSMIVDGTIVVGDLDDDAVETAKIKDANVTNAKLDKTNIPLSGFAAAAADVALGANKLTDVADPSLDQDAATKKYVDVTNSTNANLTGMVTSLGNATTVVTNANLTGDVTSVGNATTIGADKVVSSMIVDGTIVVGDLDDDAVETAKIKDANVTNAKLDKTNIPLSGFAAAAADVALGANKLTDVADPSLDQDAATKKYVDVTNSTNANLTGMVTSIGNATTVVTNANLTGDVTSVGNATTIGADKVVSSMIVDGTIVVGDLDDDAVETAKIKDANVTNAKLDKTNIPLSGFAAAAADVALGANKLTGVADPSLDQDAATKKYVDVTNSTNANLTGMVTSVGNATTVVTNANLTGDVTSVGNATTIGADKVVSSMIVDGTIATADLDNDAVETAKIKDANVTNAKLDKTNIPLSGFAAAAADVALGANKLTGVADPSLDQDAATKKYVDVTNSTNANLTGMVTSIGNATTVVTNANLTGDVTSVGNATTIGADKVVSSMIVDGTIATADLDNDAVETAKIKDANVTNAKLDKTNIPLSGFAAAAADVALGANKLTGVADPSLDQDAATKKYVDVTNSTNANLTGMVTSVGNATTVVTNANLTGDVTSVGNATTIGADKVVSSMIVDGTIVVGDLDDDAVETAKIKDANVTNAKLDKTNIPLSGFAAAAADVALGANKLTGVADPSLDQDAATKKYVDVTNSTNANLTGMVTSIGNATTVVTNANLTGDVTSVGNATTIGADKVVSSMIVDGTIVVGDLDNDAVETAKIKDANVTNAKLDKTNIPLSGFAAAAADVALGANKLTDVADPSLDQDAATKKYVDVTNSTNANLTGMVTSVGNATTVVTNANLTGDVTSVGNATTIGADKVVSSMIVDGTIAAADIAPNAVETAKIKDANVTNAKLDKTNIPLSGFAAAAADVALGANKLTGVADPTAAQDAATKAYVDVINSTNANLTGMVTSVGNATTVVTNANLTGDVTSVGNTTTIGADKVVSSMIVDGTIAAADIAPNAITTAKITDANVTNAKLDKTNIPLSGFAAAAADVALGANKLTGVADPTAAQDAATKAYVDVINSTNANLTGMVTSVGNATTVVTNANLTGDVTSVGNTTTIGADKVVSSMIVDGTIAAADIAPNAVTTAKITDANVTNAKLDKTNIPLSGFGAAAADVALGANKLTGVADPTAAQDAATKAYVDATNSTNANLTGDVTSVGNATTIGADKVVSSMIVDGTIVVGDLDDDAVETAKIKDANVTNAKLDKTNIPLSGFAAAAADVALGANKLTGVADPTAAQDAATKAYVDAGITSGTSATVSSVDNHIQSSTNDSNAATSGTEYSATASIAAGSRTFNSANSANTFNAGIDLNSNSIVSITLSQKAFVTSGPSTYNIQPVVTSIDAANNTFTITTYSFGSVVTPDSDFTFNFFVIK